MKIFVSYTHADKWQVKQIAEILENGGHDPWYNHRIIVGHDWKQAQLKAIIDCDLFLWLLSPESVKSDWCLWEFTEAVKANKPIIPVLIQRNTPMPPVLQQRQYADFTEGATPANVARLMAGVQNALYIPIQDVYEIRAVPRGVPHSVQEPTEDDNDLVFISYTRKDVDFAVQVREHLEAAGYRTWMDIYDIPAGAVWPEEIDKALNRSKVVVGIMSPASVQSQNVKNEWSWALVYKVRLVLLYLEDCRIPHRFIDLSFIDFRYDSEGKFEQLLQELSKSFNTTYTSPDTRKPLPEPSPVNINGPTERTSNAATTTSEIPAQAPPRDEIIDESEARNRSRMLDKVYNFWIKGVLDNSLHGAALIDLGMSEKRDTVNHPWNTLLRHDDYAEDIQIGTGIASLFDRMSGELLILGQPGSGKTTMLLELGRRLIEYAQEDVSQPIPVVFNLSSWADERKPISEWVIDELNAQYGVPPKIGRIWVSDDKLLLLLDGLDEVNIYHRNDCVIAINDYRSEHGLTKMAVCSRIADYEALADRFKLQGAVLIQPLSRQQIDRYLANFGDSLSGVREAIQRDEELGELAETPLMLSIMALAYRGIDANKLINTASFEEKRDVLFATYVQRMFERKLQGETYPKSTAIQWLSWLANNMVSHAQTVFLIEGLQPNWLSSAKQRRTFDLYVKLLGGLVYGVPVGIVSVIAMYFASDNLSMSLILGGGVGLSLCVAAWHTRARNFNFRGAFTFGSVFGLTFAIPALLLSDIYNGLTLGSFAGVSMATLFVLAGRRLIGARRKTGDKVESIETISWSWRKLREGAPFGFLGGAALGIVVFLTSNLIYPIEISIAAAITASFAASVAIWVPFGFQGGEVDTKTEPNQGVRRSVRNATIIGLLVAILGSIPISLVLSLLDNIKTGMSVGFAVGLASGILVWFQFGGRAFIKHIVLRYLLQKNNKIPQNYALFLDYAVSRVFLRRVGGGYIFVHRMLLEHFANLYEDNDSEKRNL